MVLRPCKSDISYSVHSTFVWQINLCISTLRTSAICANVFKSSCAWLLHHFDTVAGSLCKVFANHLLIIPLSANTVLIRFKSAILQLFVPFHGTFSRHGKAQASLALLICLTKTLCLPQSYCF